MLETTSSLKMPQKNKSTLADFVNLKGKDLEKKEAGLSRRQRYLLTFTCTYGSIGWVVRTVGPQRIIFMLIRVYNSSCTPYEQLHILPRRKWEHPNPNFGVSRWYSCNHKEVHNLTSNQNLIRRVLAKNYVTVGNLLIGTAEIWDTYHHNYRVYIKK